MLGSCVVLGCSLSSYIQRREEKDRFQIIIFVVMAIWGITVGRGVGASTHLIALSLVPGALCTSMLLSFTGHEFGRWLIDRQSRQELCLKQSTIAPIY